jgi:hypothetical protein
MSEQMKEKVRAAFPQCVAVADEFRAVFGPDVQLLYACENGVEIGTPSDASPQNSVTAAQIGITVPEEAQPKPGRRRYG